jgi:putative drug exporter of the RND superfamily
MFNKIGGFAVKYRLWIIIFWALLALDMYFFAPSLSEVGTMNESNFLPRDSESLRARELISEYFPQDQSGSTVTLVFYNPDKISEEDKIYAKQVGDWLASGATSFKVQNVTSIFHNPELESRLVSPDDTTMLMNAGLEETAFDSGSTVIVKSIRDYLKSAPEGLEIYVSGQVGIYADLFNSLSKSINLTTLLTIILVIVLLIAIYRSPVAALVPLLTIGIAFLSSRGVLGLIGKAGVSIWSQIDVFLIVMVFGIGTDYCLFLVSRYREELARRSNRLEAMKFTVGKIGSVIAASAFAVIVGLAGMAVARYQMIQTMGPGMGVAIFLTLLAALTLAPALASLFGRYLFWPRQEDLSEGSTVKHSRFWEKIAGFATGKAFIVVPVVVILMVLPYLALPKLNRSFDQLAEIPSDTGSVQGYRILEQHYDIGEMDPMEAIIVAPAGQNLTSPSSLNAISKISADLLNLNGVVKVQSAVLPGGTGQTPAGLTVSGQLAGLADSINQSLSSANIDPSMLFSSNVTDGFNTISEYLAELAGDFSSVVNEESYQKLISDLQAIQESISEIQSAALVENQLLNLSVQIDNAGREMAGSGGSSTPETTALFTALQGYLGELPVAYPDVTSEPGYQEAETLVTAIASALNSSGSSGVSSSLPDYLQQLSVGVEKIADHFRGSSDYLFSQALTQISSGTNPMETLRLELTSFAAGLQSLSAIFTQDSNHVYFPASLAASSADFQQLIAQFFSRDSRATKMYIVLDAYPQSDAALAVVKATRQAVGNSIKDTSLSRAEVVIGGTSAELSDVQQILDTDFTRVMIVVLAAIFIVLVILLRSLIAPLYLLLTVLLSYATTLGIVSWIFQDLLGQDGISFIIPIIVFVLLVALGSDYNIFLMSRVREESATRITREGARLAVIATGGVITACGIILAGTFGALVITPIRTLMQIGAAVSIGVFIDTFIVRALLVPAIASLLGRWNWWPGKHGRRS